MGVIYVTLGSQVNGSWTANNYAYAAFNSSVTPTPTPTPAPTPGPTPTVGVLGRPEQITEGSDATFTVYASPKSYQPVTVFYSTRGKATQGADYTLSGTPGQVTIPAGQFLATVTLHALKNPPDGNESA